jgi:beta-galactosidase/beta-glucuronidase
MTSSTFFTRAQYDRLVDWIPEYMEKRWVEDFSLRTWTVNGVRVEGSQKAIDELREILDEIDREIEDLAKCDMHRDYRVCR